MYTALFIHHSVGRYIIQHGGLREKLVAASVPIRLWDHDYNKIGLSNDSGDRLGHAFPVPGDNTDPPGLLNLLRTANQTIFTELPQLNLLILKSCYPNNRLSSDEALETAQATYVSMLEAADKLPLRVLLVATPPLAPERTSREESARAAALSLWLADKWRSPSVAYADIFSTLAGSRGRWKGSLSWQARRPVPFDSHPGNRGCELAAEVIVRAAHELLKK